MVDVDGVVVTPRPGGWAAEMAADLGLAPDLLQERFFRPHWPEVVVGRAGLHERLAPVLAEHAPHLTTQALAAYWFARDAELNASLLAETDALRAGGLAVHLATVQEHERAAYLWETLGLKARFDAMHYSAALGARKPEPAFYAAIEARTGFAPREMLLVDDTLANVEAARAAGWRAELWTGEAPLSELVRLP